jgi:hypothetical protein
MNKHSKYRPLLEALDEAEAVEAALREELEALKAENGLLGELIPNLAPFNVAQRLLVMDAATRTPAQSLAKIRADAIRDFADYMQDYEVDPHGFNERAVNLASEYANEIEGK